MNDYIHFAPGVLFRERLPIGQIAGFHRIGLEPERRGRLRGTRQSHHLPARLVKQARRRLTDKTAARDQHPPFHDDLTRTTQECAFI